MRHFQEGLRLSAAGRTPQAIAHFEQAVHLKSDHPALHYNLGLAYQQSMRFVDAIVAYGRALDLAPEFFEAWFNLAKAARSASHLELSLRAARTAVGLRPQDPEAHLALSETLRALGDSSGAQEALSQAVATHVKRVISSYHERKLTQAWEHAQTALRLAPDNAQACNAAGVVLLAQHRLQEAIPYLRHSVELQPDFPASWTFLGHAHLYRNDLAGAAACYDRALNLNPDFSDARYFRAWAELAAGRFENGWPEFESRWNKRGPRLPRCPVWNGESLNGQRVLIYAEHGFGDTIFFARYAPLVMGHGGRVTIECQPSLRRLLQSIPGVDAVAVRGEPLPEFDWQVSVMSLPRIFQTDLKSIPNSIPYLQAPVADEVILPPAPSARLKVGLVWGGSRMLILEQDRSAPLSSLALVLTLPGVAYYSLQLDPRRNELREVEGGERLIDLGAQLTDFAATAAAMQQLDLVISIDTAAAHLAGALGRPVWLLLVYCPDWRWMLHREDSPWYPTMRLFRQQAPDEGWERVAGRVRDALADFIRSRGGAA